MYTVTKLENVDVCQWSYDCPGNSLQLHQRSESIYVEDNCRAIDLALRDGNTGEIYNIGSGEERMNLEVSEAILEAVNADADQITFVEDRPGHDQRYALDTTKIEALGWDPHYTFEDGLERAVAYYLE